MSVEVRTTHPRGAWAVRRLRSRARAYLAALGREEGGLSVLVVGDRAIRRLNREWRAKDRPTDVLSFPAAPPPAGPPELGDVVISLDTARRAAREAGRTLGAELDRYLAHGLLHLLGHDHHRPAEARRMAAAEDRLVGEGMVRAAGVGAPGGRAQQLSPTRSPATGARDGGRGGRASPLAVRRRGRRIPCHGGTRPIASRTRR